MPETMQLGSTNVREQKEQVLSEQELRNVDSPRVTAEQRRNIELGLEKVFPFSSFQISPRQLAYEVVGKTPEAITIRLYDKAIQEKHEWNARVGELTIERKSGKVLDLRGPEPVLQEMEQNPTRSPSYYKPLLSFGSQILLYDKLPDTPQAKELREKLVHAAVRELPKPYLFSEKDLSLSIQLDQSKPGSDSLTIDVSDLRIPTPQGVTAGKVGSIQYELEKGSFQAKRVAELVLYAEAMGPVRDKRIVEQTQQIQKEYASFREYCGVNPSMKLLGRALGLELPAGLMLVESANGGFKKSGFSGQIVDANFGYGLGSLSYAPESGLVVNGEKILKEELREICTGLDAERGQALSLGRRLEANYDVELRMNEGRTFLSVTGKKEPGKCEIEVIYHNENYTDYKFEGRSFTRDEILKVISLHLKPD